MHSIHTIGIIGLGSFGTFIASLVPPTADVKIYGFDQRQATYPTGVHAADLTTVAHCDIVILAVPLEAYEQVLPRLTPTLRPETLIIDICSVKSRPEALFEQYLIGHRSILLTHPLFGPQSAAKGHTKGHTLIVTKTSGELAETVVAWCKRVLGLDIRYMSAVEHDKIMAQVHALTFFVARGLSDLNVGESPFTTPSYRLILDLIELDRTHSNELFNTIQRGNPYADAMRQQVLKSFNELESELKP